MRHTTSILIASLALGAMINGCTSPTGTAPGDRGSKVSPVVAAVADAPAPEVRIRHANGAVATDSKPASEAGVEILKAGGNAVDAAIATALTLSVTRPYSCGLGGGGFMLIFVEETGESRALDFRETCPTRVGPEFYVNLPPSASGYDPSLYGGRAVAIPGQLPGMIAAHDAFGTLPLEVIVAPAVRAARAGFAVDANYLSAVEKVRSLRKSHPDLRPTSRWIWDRLCQRGVIEVGDIIRQPELAEYLERFGREGIEAWSGPEGIAALLTGVDRAFDGVLRPRDIQDYKVVWREPLVVKNVFEDYDALLMPPPVSYTHLA
ncbi:MAG: gamma-glutamyltransferase, partial [Phycisphaerales bacterium]